MNKLKIMTIIGTRPEIIRLSVIINKLDKLVNHKLVFTNQNYTASLSTQFFVELGIRQLDYTFKKQQKHFLVNAMTSFENIIENDRPDKILILGDTNSGLLALIAAKAGIPIIHMESGNRCFDSRVPEELNRKLIDTMSTYNLPYTENSKQNLLAEGFHKNYVFKTGNPIYEVLNYYAWDIKNSNILPRLGLKEQGFVLVTAHRTENVDDFDSLVGIINAINEISKQFRVIFSLHPRTKDKITQFNIDIAKNVMLSRPLGFFDFVKLEKTAKLVISDSGTVQEECCIFGVPSITIRNSTERQETVECGSNILSGTDTKQIMNIFNTLTNRPYKWKVPEDYLVENVSDIVINILLGRVGD